MEGSRHISNDMGSSWEAIVQSSRQFALPGNPRASPHAHGSRTCPATSNYPHLDPPNFPLPTYIRDVPSLERIAGAPTTRRTTSRPALPSNSLTSSLRNRLGSLAAGSPLEMPTVLAPSPIDLTTDSLPSFSSLPRMSANPRKRPASSSLDPRHSSASQSHSIKRRALNISDRESGIFTKIDEADLTEVNDDNSLFEVMEQQKEQQRELQRLKAVKAQQDLAKQPVTFSTLKCIICMESMKDVTATHCGHIFCYGCLMEALIASEHQGPEPKGPPKCPVCRKRVLRPREKKQSTHCIPLEIKMGKRPSKGKEREND